MWQCGFGLRHIAFSKQVACPNPHPQSIEAQIKTPNPPQSPADQPHARFRENKGPPGSNQDLNCYRIKSQDAEPPVPSTLPPRHCPHLRFKFQNPRI